ncbi:hypothetical protein [Variovorax ginsengisoli]|jgi:hypothetical protein|uniref:Uncharacterized protein n=1 Tax=Variovorax ginsengisoli TaxID=363844 RepID=A0ABT8S8X1_9BURK|nr:hypothetical protein [Variovorax ginsengisoli]MDN8616045.1 hypothetical protein [Variovorax ginsengisoli]MDO1535215.1 hypothetical protein [Variovorax ginsengisoli]
MLTDLLRGQDSRKAEKRITVVTRSGRGLDDFPSKTFRRLRASQGATSVCNGKQDCA